MIFIASVEVKPLPGSKMPGGRVGALAYILIAAASKTVAKKRLQEALKEDKYGVVKIEFLKDYKAFRWKGLEDQVEYDRLAKRAALNDAVIYGRFYTWERDE